MPMMLVYFLIITPWSILSGLEQLSQQPASSFGYLS